MHRNRCYVDFERNSFIPILQRTVSVNLKKLPLANEVNLVPIQWSISLQDRQTVIRWDKVMFLIAGTLKVWKSYFQLVRLSRITYSETIGIRSRVDIDHRADPDSNPNGSSFLVALDIGHCHQIDGQFAVHRYHRRKKALFHKSCFVPIISELSYELSKCCASFQWPNHQRPAMRMEWYLNS